MRWIRWGPMLLLLAAGTASAQSGTNILVNGNFPNSAGLSGWDSFGNVSHDPTRDVDGAPDSGSALLKANNDVTGLVQCVNLPPGTAGGPGRLAGATFLHPGSPGTALVVGTFFTGPDCGGMPVSVQVLDGAMPNTWSRQMKDFTVPANAGSVRTELVVTGSAMANIDALSVEVGTSGPPPGGPDVTIEFTDIEGGARPGGRVILIFVLKNVGTVPTQGPVTVSLSGPANTLIPLDVQFTGTLVAGESGAFLEEPVATLVAIPGLYLVTATVSGGGDVNPSNNMDQIPFDILPPRAAAPVSEPPPLSTRGRRPSND